MLDHVFFVKQLFKTERFYIEISVPQQKIARCPSGSLKFARKKIRIEIDNIIIFQIIDPLPGHFEVHNKIWIVRRTSIIVIDEGIQ